MSLFDFITDLSARQLSQRVTEAAWPQAGGQTRPHADSGMQGAAHKHGFGRTAHAVHGTIVDYTAMAHCYKVQLSGGLPTVAAFKLAQTSCSIIGAREINVLGVGTGVWVLLGERTRYGYIVGVDPPTDLDARLQLLDMLSQTSRARVDGANRTALKMSNGGGVVNKIAGRPFDGIGNDTGWINAKGGKISIDDWLIQLAVNEACGIFGFQHDILLRIAAYNLEMRTSGWNHDVFNDQEEIFDVYGSTPYPWEHLGLFQRSDARRELSPMAFQIEEPHYANWEPKHDDQRPFHRHLRFGGYLGQGKAEFQALPPKEPPEIARLSVEMKLLGVHQDVVTLTGTRGIRAAGGIFFVKTPNIPVPVQKKRPEDGRGDKNTNYKAAGTVGSGPEHKVSQVKVEGQEKSLRFAAGILDLQANLFNWMAGHPFHYHTEDWDLPEESEMIDGKLEKPDFSQLKGSMYIDLPEPKMLKVDERYGEQAYYPTMSTIAQLPDGSIRIGDGSGAEIRMAGGHLFLSAPGDIWLKAGRNVNNWAGWDATVRAQNAFEISATNGGGYIKAEKHLHMLGGNDGAQGSVLIESRSARGPFDFTSPGEDAKASGIILRTPKADVIAQAANIYLRTGSDDGSVQSGQIVLDAHRGKEAIVLYGRQVTQYVQQSADILFGTEGNFNKGITLTEGFARFGMPLSVGEALLINGPIVARNGIQVTDGHIATSANVPTVGTLKDQALEQASATLDETATAVNTTLLQEAKTRFETSPKKLFHEDGQAGNDTILKTAQFSFRTPADYKTEAWVLYFDHWQELADTEAAKWREKPVATENGGNRYPYPGTRYYEEGDSLKRQPLLLFDRDAGYAHDRGSLYENPTLKEPTPINLNSYPVIMN
jgi:hypothetical protein